MRSVAKLCAGIVLLCGTACSQRSAERSGKPPVAETSDRKDESTHEELPNRVRLSVKVAAQAGVKTAAVRVEALPETVNVTGELPSAVGVPEISPVTESMLRPEGRPLASTLVEGEPPVVVT